MQEVRMRIRIATNKDVQFTAIRDKCKEHLTQRYQTEDSVFLICNRDQYCYLHIIGEKDKLHLDIQIVPAFCSSKYCILPKLLTDILQYTMR